MVPRTHNQTMYNGEGNTLKTTGQHREPLSPQPPRPGHPTQPLTTPPLSVLVAHLLAAAVCYALLPVLYIHTTFYYHYNQSTSW